MSSLWRIEYVFNYTVILTVSALADEGIAVLGIERRNRIYIGAPYGETYVYPGDTIIAYGRKAALVELDMRPQGIEGEQAHLDAIAIQQHIESKQLRRDRKTQNHLVD